MNSKSVVLIAVILFGLVLTSVYVWGPSSVPPGQEPLLAISNATFSGFENAFDNDANAPRLVLLLSPT